MGDIAQAHEQSRLVTESSYVPSLPSVSPSNPSTLPNASLARFVCIDCQKTYSDYRELVQHLSETHYASEHSVDDEFIKFADQLAEGTCLAHRKKSSLWDEISLHEDQWSALYKLHDLPSALDNGDVEPQHLTSNVGEQPSEHAFYNLEANVNDVSVSDVVHGSGGADSVLSGLPVTASQSEIKLTPHKVKIEQSDTPIQPVDALEVGKYNQHAAESLRGKRAAETSLSPASGLADQRYDAVSSTCVDRSKDTSSDNDPKAEPSPKRCRADSVDSGISEGILPRGTHPNHDSTSPFAEASARREQVGDCRMNETGPSTDAESSYFIPTSCSSGTSSGQKHPPPHRSQKEDMPAKRQRPSDRVVSKVLCYYFLSLQKITSQEFEKLSVSLGLPVQLLIMLHVSVGDLMDSHQQNPRPRESLTCKFCGCDYDDFRTHLFGDVHMQKTIKHFSEDAQRDSTDLQENSGNVFDKIKSFLPQTTKSESRIQQSSSSTPGEKAETMHLNGKTSARQNAQNNRSIANMQSDVSTSRGKGGQAVQHRHRNRPNLTVNPSGMLNAAVSAGNQVVHVDHRHQAQINATRTAVGHPATAGNVTALERQNGERLPGTSMRHPNFLPRVPAGNNFPGAGVPNTLRHPPPPYHTILHRPGIPPHPYRTILPRPNFGANRPPFVQGSGPVQQQYRRVVQTGHISTVQKGISLHRQVPSAGIPPIFMKCNSPSTLNYDQNASVISRQLNNFRPQMKPSVHVPLPPQQHSLSAVNPFSDSALV